MNYYTDDGILKEGVGWSVGLKGQVLPDIRQRVCAEMQGTVEAEVAIQRHRTDRDNIAKAYRHRQATDEGFRQARNDYNKLLREKKATLAKDGSIALDESSDYKFDEPPPADELVESFLEPIITQYAPTHAALVYVFKASCAVSVQNGTFVFSIKHREDEKAFTSPTRRNHVLTNKGYHFLGKELSRMEPDNLAPGSGIPFVSTYCVFRDGAKGFAYEIKLVDAAKKAMKAMREKVPGYLGSCVLNEVGGGNGNHSSNVGAAGIAVLVVKLDDFRFNADKSNQKHLNELLQQVPGSTSIKMNEKKSAMLERVKKTIAAHKAKKEAAAKAGAESKSDQKKKKQKT